MARFLFRRLAGVAVSLWVAVTLTFLMIHLLPGDPAEAALSQSTAPPEVISQRRAALGLDLPLMTQYIRYVGTALTGQFGLSWSSGQPVGYLISQQLGPTGSLAASGLLVALLTGAGLGLTAALGGQGLLGEASRSTTGVLMALPVMFTGALVVWVFAVGLDWFPATGQGGLRFLVLPALVVGTSASGGIARAVDSGLTEAMVHPFFTLARAKGFTRFQATVRHAVRVGFLPALDVVALQLGFLLSGTVVTETVFARQGIGRVLLSAVLDKDLPVVQAVVILSALAYSMVNLIADLAHAWADPRIRPDIG